MKIFKIILTIFLYLMAAFLAVGGIGAVMTNNPIAAAVLFGTAVSIILLGLLDKKFGFFQMFAVKILVIITAFYTIGVIDIEEQQITQEQNLIEPADREDPISERY